MEHGDAVTSPAKVMRIGSMVKMLLEEVRTAPLDEPSRERLAEIYERSIAELSDALSPDLQHELKMLALPFRDGEVPTEGEIRVAKAQLVGWLEGLFHGIQATLFAQQLAARQQLEQIRQLPPGAPGGDPAAGVPGQPQFRPRTPRHVSLGAAPRRLVAAPCLAGPGGPAAPPPRSTRPHVLDGVLPRSVVVAVSRWPWRAGGSAATLDATHVLDGVLPAAPARCWRPAVPQLTRPGRLLQLGRRVCGPGSGGSAATLDATPCARWGASTLDQTRQLTRPGGRAV